MNYYKDCRCCEHLLRFGEVAFTSVLCAFNVLQSSQSKSQKEARNKNGGIFFHTKKT